MKQDILDLKGNKTTQMTLKAEVFDSVPNIEAVMQYIRIFKSNNRQGTSSTKTRSEVSGSGAKPWRQKGTGRARVGDKRNPIWRHGGVSHGPQPRSWNLGMPKGLKSIALKSALGYKAKADKLVILEDLNGLSGKVKEASEMLKALKLTGRTLVVVDSIAENIMRGFGNIKKVEIADVAKLNTYQILKADTVLFTKSAVKNLEKKILGEK